jgi:hypothetical protein
MGNSHFEFYVARTAKSYKIIKQIGFILAFVKTSTVNMMNIKRSPIKTSFSSTVQAYFISIKNFSPDLFPTFTEGEFFSPSPVRAIFSYHMRFCTFTAAILSSFFNGRWKCFKFSSTINTGIKSIFFLRFIVAFFGAMLSIFSYLVKGFSANGAVNISHLGATPSRLTLAATKNIFHIFPCAGFLPLKFFVAKGTSIFDFITFCSATCRAKSNYTLIGFEIFSTSGASLDHS